MRAGVDRTGNLTYEVPVTYGRGCMQKLTALAVISLLLVWPICGMTADFQTGQDAFNRGDYTTALSVLLPLAKEGDKAAQTTIGTMYARGLGVTQDFSQALAWYSKAAAQGDSTAQVKLGWLYANGNGIPQDFTEASKWFRKSADTGSASGEASLGTLYYQGLGVSQDYQKASQLFMAAANQGDPFAQYSLGLLYQKGLGVPQDDSESRSWLLKSANQGFPPAKSALGFPTQGPSPDPILAATSATRSALVPTLGGEPVTNTIAISTTPSIPLADSKTMGLWKKEGFTPEEAQKWSAAGFVPYIDTTTYINNDAKQWRDDGFQPNEAKQWVDAGVTEPVNAKAWKAVTTPLQYKTDNCCGVWGVKSQAAQWEQEGFTPEEAKQWHAAGFVPYFDSTIIVKDAKHWKDQGFTPSEAKKWMDGTIYDPSVAGAWKNAGISIRNTLLLTVYQVPLKQAPALVHFMDTHCHAPVHAGADIDEFAPQKALGVCFIESVRWFQTLGKQSGLYALTDPFQGAETGGLIQLTFSKGRFLHGSAVLLIQITGRYRYTNLAGDEVETASGNVLTPLPVAMMVFGMNGEHYPGEVP